MTSFTIRPAVDADRQWIAQFVEEHWGSDKMVVHGRIFIISQLPIFIAEMDGQAVGLVSFHIEGQECEITSLDSLREAIGIGAALIDKVKAAALEAGCRRLFLSTTNDNIHALRFYQRRGFVLAALRVGAVEAARKIKPQIPMIGFHGIPIRDEIELEIYLTGR
jgi:N-acetylglutamate synthase-like GNAT family acetyltransferase